MLAALQSIITHLGLHADVYALIIVFSLAFARIVSAVALVPFLGGPSVPGQAKIGLSVLIASILVPSLAGVNPARDISSIMYLGLLVKEIMIGITLGVVAQMVFYSIQMTGVLIDTQRGMNQITYLAPQLQGHTSALGNFQFQAALVVFLTINGHLIFIRAMADTFAVLPLFTLPTISPGILPLLSQIARIGANTLLWAAQLSAPVVLAMFLVDLAFACVGKASPSIRLNAESQTVKGFVGLVLVFFIAAFLVGQLQTYLLQMLRDIAGLAKSVR